MADRLQANLGLIRSLIERAPDKAVVELEAALSGGMGGGALVGVRSMIEAEVRDRSSRDTIFAPLKPMFGQRADGVVQQSFPAAAFSRLWRASKQAFPDEALRAARARPDEGQPPPEWDQLCAHAAAALRDGAHPDFAALAQMLDAGAPGQAAELAAYLELTHIARAALLRLPEWLQRMTEDRAATARLAYKDAVAIRDDSGPRLFQVIFANLQEPWVTLRVIAAVMARPGDAYISGSELAVFGERLLEEIDRRLEQLKRFDFDGGAEAAMEICAHVRIISAIATEFEQSLHLGREGPWGHRLNKQKAALAKAAEGYLKKADGVVAAALPLAPVRIGGRTVRSAPKLDLPPDTREMRRARAVLTFVEQMRSVANAGGFSTLRGKVCEEVEHRLNSYVEDLLLTIHDGEGEEVAYARLYLDEAADLMGRIRDQKAAQIVRRRAAAA